MTTPFDDDVETSDSPLEDETSVSSDSDETLSRLQQERDSLYERLARTTADYQNSRKRLETEMDQRMQYANSSLIKTLLPVIDNLQRAMAVDPAKTDVPSILKGLQVVLEQWMNLLKNQHVELIAPEVGTPFDPTKHEALMQQENDQYTEPTVTQLFQNGYALHGRTLRPASVAVSKTS